MTSTLPKYEASLRLPPAEPTNFPMTICCICQQGTELSATMQNLWLEVKQACRGQSTISNCSQRLKEPEASPKAVEPVSSSKDFATNDRHNGKDCGASLGLQLQFTLHNCGDDEYSKNRTFCNNVKAMAGVEASLQKSKQQVQPKMKVPQASPKVLLNQFPVARTVQQMMDTMERMMEDPLVYGSTSPLIVAGDDEYSKGKIPWAIKEGQRDYKMRFNMPGMNKNDVKVWVEQNMLVVKAEKALEENHEGRADSNEDWPANSYGRYTHRLALPENIEFDKSKAKVKDEILYVTIRKGNTSAKVIGIDVK